MLSQTALTAPACSPSIGPFRRPRRAPTATATVGPMRVLSIVHDDSPTGGGGSSRRSSSSAATARALVTPHGDAPPDDPGACDAIMVFGGAMHPDQDAEHPWLAGETAFIEAALDAGVPLLGVCLGAQLIARAAGAESDRRARRGRLARCRADRRGRADPGARHAAARVEAFQWHYYTFDLPRARSCSRRARPRPGLPHRRPGLGRPVPPRGRARDARRLVRAGGASSQADRGRRGGDRPASARGTSRAGRLRGVPRGRAASTEARPLQPLARRAARRSARPFVPRADVVARLVAGRRSTSTANAERLPEWQYAITSAPASAPTSARTARRRCHEQRATSRFRAPGM